MSSDFDREYNEMLWESWIGEHPKATEDDAIRYWAQIHLSQVYWMNNSDVLDALMHLYKGDSKKALDSLVTRRMNEAVDNYIHKGAVTDLDWND